MEEDKKSSKDAKIEVMHKNISAKHFPMLRSWIQKDGELNQGIMFFNEDKSLGYIIFASKFNGADIREYEQPFRGRNEPFEYEGMLIYPYSELTEDRISTYPDYLDRVFKTSPYTKLKEFKSKIIDILNSKNKGSLPEHLLKSIETKNLDKTSLSHINYERKQAVIYAKYKGETQFILCAGLNDKEAILAIIDNKFKTFVEFEEVYWAASIKKDEFKEAIKVLTNA